MTTDYILSCTNKFSLRSKKRQSKRRQQASTSGFFKDYRANTLSKAEFNALPNAFATWPTNFGQNVERAKHSRFFPVNCNVNGNSNHVIVASVGSYLRLPSGEKWAGWVELEWLRADPVGCRVGHRAMAKLVAIADKHKQPLVLQAYPLLPNNRIPTLKEKKKLRNFYKEYGFRSIGGDLMIRRPHWR